MMRIEPTAVADSWVCAPTAHVDDRGFFVEWFRGDLLQEATGRRFDVVQANHAVSARGVVRGVHLTTVPPGQAKFVYCTAGSILDVIVDVRVGSPTFGSHAAVRLDSAQHRAVFLSAGLGHAYCALEDDTSVAYLASSRYEPDNDLAVSPIDPELGLPWPQDLGRLTLSAKDEAAPPLQTALRAGFLPAYDACVRMYAEQGPADA